MLSPEKVAAIYVPIELEHDVEDWLRRKYNLRTLAESPVRSRNEEHTSLRSECMPSSRSPEAPQRVSRSHEQGKGKVSPATIPTPRGNSHLRKQVSRSPEPTLRANIDAKVKDEATRKRTNPKSSQQRSNSSSRASVWDRLATPPKHREASAQPPPRGERTTTARTPKRRPAPDPSDDATIFDRLYHQGLSQYQRHERAAEEARQRRLTEEAVEMRRGSVLMKVLSNSENYGLKGAALAKKVDEAVEKSRHRYTDAELQEQCTRLSRRHSVPNKQSRAPTREEREMTFHPKISESPARHTEDELRQHFDFLYMDARKKERFMLELRDHYHHKERRTMLERRLRDDVHFRKRVEEDPAIGDAYCKAL